MGFEHFLDIFWTFRKICVYFRIQGDVGFWAFCGHFLQTACILGPDILPILWHFFEPKCPDCVRPFWVPQIKSLLQD